MNMLRSMDSLAAKNLMWRCQYRRCVRKAPFIRLCHHLPPPLPSCLPSHKKVHWSLFSLQHRRHRGQTIKTKSAPLWSKSFLVWCGAQWCVLGHGYWLSRALSLPPHASFISTSKNLLISAEMNKQQSYEVAAADDDFNQMSNLSRLASQWIWHSSRIAKF